MVLTILQAALWIALVQSGSTISTNLNGGSTYIQTMTSVINIWEATAGDAYCGCSGNMTEIMEYLRMGMEEIQWPDTKNIVVVIGPSGVGKSSLVQFVANSSNTLRAQCRDGLCKLIDDTGTIGDEIISKTFLPNLVDNNDDSTPYYDMPGFKDNRSPAIEIANAFFMQQVLNASEKVKIVVVVRDSSFTNSDRLTFKAMMPILAGLIKNPTKLSGGMGIIGTIAQYELTPVQLVSRYARFLKCDLLANVDELFDTNAKRIKEIIKSWIPNSLKKDCNADTFTEERISFFKQPHNENPLVEQPKLRINKERLETMLTDGLDFMPIGEDNFGMPLTLEAIDLLRNTSNCLSCSITEGVSEVAKQLENKIHQELSKFSTTETPDHSFLNTYLSNLVSTDLDFSQLPYNSPSAWGEKMLEILNSIDIAGNFTEEVKLTVIDAVVFYKFVETTTAYDFIPFEPEDWVKPIVELTNVVFENCTSIAKTIHNETLDELTLSARKYLTEVLSSISKEQSIEMKQKSVDKFFTSVESIQTKLSLEISKENATLHKVLEVYSVQLSSLLNCPNCFHITTLKKIQTIEIVGDFGWKSRENEWLAPVSVTLKQGIQKELDLTTFLIQLFKDLSSPKFHSSDTAPLDLRSFWLETRVVTESNLLTIFHYIGSTTATTQFSYDVAKEFILHMDNKNRLESLLNTHFEPLECPTGPKRNFTGNFLSIKNIKSCLSGATDITIMATHSLYIDDVLTGNLINPSENININLLTYNLVTAGNWLIDLSGTEAVPVAANNIQSDISIQAASGINGGPAGTMYLLYGQLATRVGGGSAKVLSPKINGGKGGDGARGSQGGTGIDGREQYFKEHDDAYCKAWLGGDIQVRVYKNSCNRDDSLKCHAPDDGVWVTIYGTDGTQGGQGGKGGNAGSGGPAGQYVVKNFLTNKPNTSNGINGLHGSPGIGGPGGLGGQMGDELHVKIDDAKGTGGKHCSENGRYVVPSKLFASSGPAGQSGAQAVQTGPQKVIDRTQVKTAYETLKIRVTTLVGNEFLNQHVLEFNKNLSAGTPLDP